MHNVETEKKRIVDKIRHLKSLIQFYYNYDFNNVELKSENDHTYIEYHYY